MQWLGRPGYARFDSAADDDSIDDEHAALDACVALALTRDRLLPVCDDGVHATLRVMTPVEFLAHRRADPAAAIAVGPLRLRPRPTLESSRRSHSPWGANERTWRVRAASAPNATPAKLTPACCASSRSRRRGCSR
jgi:hypothetical protein